ncbi:similar to Saccharomyces cerevisiae YDR516C EMI2 Non-essential protein of unknown function required for transcriptional induction of the early meiotic-specific transcription factor IME1 [Maudiozyma saulgeensis]|uniref:Phosphotransferase n=1 Tax=Maudiozyma saulgeensis TaxID=1789683 RepID=A0A1X7R7G9_9SACH|nr:similar to Saccharomyces cerevisiae YDR516C EMI2 Non-essential protein of unknown function required for transcriptional induction of the early meiotic-specific transcription factor IME1 [Kazachstania saulgeensis]
MSFDEFHKINDTKLLEEVTKICAEFEVTADQLKDMTSYFIEQMEIGLANNNNNEGMINGNNAGLAMIPSYVTSKPNGTEEGLFMAAVLGGMNFRICSVQLNGDHTFNIKQAKTRIPEYLMEGTDATSDDLFGFLARRTSAFINKFHSDIMKPDTPLKLGFTFSYPVDQESLNSGTLIRWTKGLNIPDTVGKDVVQLYQEQLTIVGLNMVNVVALTNDTIGTFLSLCYAQGITSDGQVTGEISEPVIGCIFGTGTNGCYMEKIENIKKLPDYIRERLIHEGKTEMCINIEWGSFDNDNQVLPTTRYDIDIDKKYARNGGQLFEKRVSGMFLGEILRNVLVDLHSRGLILTQFRKHEQLPHRLKTPFQLSSEVLARIEIDDSSTLRETELSFLQSLRLPTTLAERKAIQSLVRVISRRSAYLASVPIAAILIKTGALNKKYHGEVTVGYDGSIIELYPGFKSMMRQALAMGPIGSEGERKTHFVHSKDSGSAGGALCALVA